ncbi:hypothetical protein [Sphingomonas solaris]|uniref:hypothetical protein n=1 Tax=Alterirhizorhabdus solaris TaxID=2529389 RepID=UPI001396A18E|nr:hypothetical protein [Sphingomonas solaris]
MSKSMKYAASSRTISKDQADVLAVDLMAGLSVPQVVRRMIREEYDDDPDGTMSLYTTWNLHRNLWHRLERLNAVRAMFDPKLRQLAVPDVYTVRRHLIELQKTLDAG